MTKFEGNWVNQGFFTGEMKWDVQYNFVDTEFTLTDTFNELSLKGTFSFTDTTITFRSFTIDAEWTQNYELTETYFDLQANENNNFCGRFYKI